MKRIIISFIAIFAVLGAMAQEQTAKVGSIVKNVEIRDSKNDPIMLPFFGEKHILVFYPDPEVHKQNQEFTDNLEENQIDSDNIYSFGVVNMKDAPLYPNSIIRSVSRKKEKKTGATIYTDPDHLLRDGWGLGDCNDLFVIIFVSKEGEIKFLKKGKMDGNDIKEFYKVIDQHK